jgi:tRNA-Thr(GGU) m(6)t(6)A37 methyltransferase TsaA
MAMDGSMKVDPIGWVKGSNMPGCMEIELLPEFSGGLFRVEDLDSILVLFLFDRSDVVNLLVHPRGNPRNPLVGVFASCSPDRPNHIGATVVRLIHVDKNVLTVEGLDSWEGTPVLDIKPHRPRAALSLAAEDIY